MGVIGHCVSPPNRGERSTRMRTNRPPCGSCQSVGHVLVLLPR